MIFRNRRLICVLTVNIVILFFITKKDTKKFQIKQASQKYIFKTKILENKIILKKYIYIYKRGKALLLTPSQSNLVKVCI